MRVTARECRLIPFRKGYLANEAYHYDLCRCTGKLQEQKGTLIVGGNLCHLIDHEDLNGAFRGLQSEPELLLKGRE
jgi:hypothetical protein